MKAASVQEFADWLRSAKRGYRMTYYLGFLAVDRQTEVAIGRSIFTIPNAPADNIGNAAAAAEEAGQVLLVQKRGPVEGSFEYIAIKT